MAGKMATWKVSHYPHNPRNQSTEWYDTKADAVYAAKGRSSDDPNDTQCTYIENAKTGQWGKRTWGKKNIQWHKK